MTEVLAVTSRVLVAAAIVATSLAVVGAPGSAQPRAVANDIDGDGDGDLLVGVPLEDVNGQVDAGQVNVIRSNGGRLRAAGNRILSGADAGSVEAFDLFGSAVELADVDGDGYADAVIGASGHAVGLEVNAGEFHVIPGSPTGPRTAGSRAYHQGANGLPDEAELDDFFGFDITSGDFNGDQYSDIAVSAPFEGVGQHLQAGAVTVIHGSAAGLDPTSAVVFSQAGPVAGRPAEGDLMGWSLASGDFDGDGFDDLVVGTPGDDHRRRDNAGAVNVLYGSRTGITTDRNQRFSQAGTILGRPQPDDLFGFSVAASDMNCDGRDDLLVGVPNETVKGTDPAGAVHVLLGSPAGLRKAGNRRLLQSSRRVAGSVGFHQFGASLTAGDFDGDGCGDVVVGAPTTDIGGGSGPCASDPRCAAEAGAVVAVYGGSSWPVPAGSRLFSQAGDVAGAPQFGDSFGRTLATVDINGDGRDDLVVGVPGEDIRGRSDAGAIVVIRGSAKGLSSARSYAVSQQGRIKGVPEADDRFSSSLFSGGS